MNIITIGAVDIQDAWYQAIYKIIDSGHRYTNQRGSYEGEDRIEFEYANILITDPYKDPYDLMLPQIPAAIGIPNPVDSGYVEQYLPYLMTSAMEPNETYTYGSRIEPQINYWINILRSNPATNQSVLQVAQPSDMDICDPPCLRHIDIKVKDGQLNFFPYFRSWDLWGGFPANLAAIAVLQKYMADEIGVNQGYILASSKGLHIYGYAEQLAKIRCGR